MVVVWSVITNKDEKNKKKEMKINWYDTHMNIKLER